MHIFSPRELIFWQILAVVRRSVCQNIYELSRTYSFLSNHKKLHFFTSHFDSMFALKNFRVPFLYSFSKKFESIPVCWSSKTRKRRGGTRPNFQSKMGAKNQLNVSCTLCYSGKFNFVSIGALGDPAYIQPIIKVWGRPHRGYSRLKTLQKWPFFDFQPKRPIRGRKYPILWSILIDFYHKTHLGGSGQNSCFSWWQPCYTLIYSRC